MISGGGLIQTGMIRKIDASLPLGYDHRRIRITATTTNTGVSASTFNIFIRYAIAERASEIALATAAIHAGPYSTMYAPSIRRESKSPIVDTASGTARSFHPPIVSDISFHIRIVGIHNRHHHHHLRRQDSVVMMLSLLPR